MQRPGSVDDSYGEVDGVGADGTFEVRIGIVGDGAVGFGHLDDETFPERCFGQTRVDQAVDAEHAVDVAGWFLIGCDQDRDVGG